MKKTLLCLAAALVMLTSACAQAEGGYIMTREEMQDIYQQSCERMNTSGWFDITTLDELPVYFRHGDDLIITSLPMEGDLPYAEALRLAKIALRDRYDISISELNAMGVYPRFQDYVYLDDESEWEFYFTPVRDIDFRQAHDLPAGGEYLAVIGARTGKTIKAVWYSGWIEEPILEELAWEAALIRSEMNPQVFKATFAPPYIDHYDQEPGTCLALIYTHTADQSGGDNHVYQVILNCKTGEIISLEYTDGVG